MRTNGVVGLGQVPMAVMKQFKARCRQCTKHDRRFDMFVICHSNICHVFILQISC